MKILTSRLTNSHVKLNSIAKKECTLDFRLSCIEVCEVFVIVIGTNCNPVDIFSISSLILEIFWRSCVPKSELSPPHASCNRDEITSNLLVESSRT